jgi:hypothetical protein
MPSKPIMLLMSVMVIGSTLILQSMFTVYVLGSSPYDSGYDHGCSDAGLQYNNRYINEPEKGPEFHTDKFMDGYYDGFSNCSRTNVEQSPAQSQSSSDNYNPNREIELEGLHDNNGDGVIDEKDDWSKDCYNAGYDDGQDGPFEEGTWRHCVDGNAKDDYYDAFIDGCKDAGNTEETCEQFTDN